MAAAIIAIADKPRIEVECFVASDVGQSLMAVAYLRMEKDGTLDTVFFQHVPTLKEFISWLEAKDNVYLGCFVRNDSSQAVLAGMAWLWNVRGVPGARIADGGGCFFREYWRDRITERLTEKSIEHWFGVVGLDAVYGWSLAENRAALRIVKRLGFTVSPPLPKFTSKQGHPADAVISYLTADTWRALRHGL